MRELSLFSGAGGGLLGSLLLGWETIGYVEFNDYCQRVIAQRIRDGILPNAPIYGDIRTFVSEGYAAAYQGMVDVISGGFPCQPFSVAGKRAGADDERNMWPATIATVRAVRPRYCFFENVPGLLSSGYFERILCDLTESGYSVRWRCLSAAEVGAPHKRDRLWIVAHANGRDGDRWTEPRDRGPGRSNLLGKDRTTVGVAHSDSQHGIGGSESQQPISQGGEAWPEPGGGSTDVAYPTGKGLEGQQRAQFEGAGARLTDSSWWRAEPRLGRLANGVPDRIHRLKAAGNGQVPIVAAAAWHLLTQDINS